MGRIAYSVAVTGHGDVDAARAALWNTARDVIGAFQIPGAYGEVREYLDNADPCLTVENAGDTWLYWSFPDLAGLCHRSAAAWWHWLHLAFAVEWHRMVFEAGECGFTITSDRPDLAEGLTTSDRHFVVLRDYLWQVASDGLYGDDRYLARDALTAEESTRYAEARDLCRCGMCSMLRPDDPTLFDTMLADLADGDPAKARYAAWYLVRMRQVRPDILIAMINTGPTMDRLRDMANVVERYAVRIDIAWPMLRPIVPHLRPGAHDLALYALAALYPQQPEPEREWFQRELEAASEPTGRASQTAATLLYFLGRQ